MSSLFDADDGLPINDLMPTFFALYPDSKTIQWLTQLWARLCKEQGLDKAPVKNYHMTLFLIGPQAKLTRRIAEAAMEAGASVSAAPFEVVFDEVLTFASVRPDKPIVTLAKRGMPAWLDFQQRLGLAVLKAGAIKAMPNYAPHLTLAYHRKPIERFEIEPVRWVAREFSLTRSDPAKGQHHKLATWPMLASEVES